MSSLGSITNRGNFTITVDDDIVIDEIVGSHATIVSNKGSITVHKTIDSSTVSLQAGGEIHIGEKIDNHSTVSAYCHGDITIGQKVDQHSTAYLTSYNAGINIGEKIDQHSNGVLTAKTIYIGQKIDQHSDVHLYAAISITVVQGVDNESIVVWKAPTINCPVSDGGSLWQWPLNAYTERARAVSDRMESVLSKLPQPKHPA